MSCKLNCRRHGEGIAHGLGAVLSFTIADAIPRGDCPTAVYDLNPKPLPLYPKSEILNPKKPETLNPTLNRNLEPKRTFQQWGGGGVCTETYTVPMRFQVEC